MIVIQEGEEQVQHTDKIYQEPTRGPAEKVSVQCSGPRPVIPFLF